MKKNHSLALTLFFIDCCYVHQREVSNIYRERDRKIKDDIKNNNKKIQIRGRFYSVCRIIRLLICSALKISVFFVVCLRHTV